MSSKILLKLSVNKIKEASYLVTYSYVLDNSPLKNIYSSFNKNFT